MPTDTVADLSNSPDNVDTTRNATASLRQASPPDAPEIPPAFARPLPPPPLTARRRPSGDAGKRPRLAQTTLELRRNYGITASGLCGLPFVHPSHPLPRETSTAVRAYSLATATSSNMAEIAAKLRAYFFPNQCASIVFDDGDYFNGDFLCMAVGRRHNRRVNFVLLV